MKLSTSFAPPKANCTLNNTTIQPIATESTTQTSCAVSYGHNVFSGRSHMISHQHLRNYACNYRFIHLKKVKLVDKVKLNCFLFVITALSLEYMVIHH